MIITKTKKVFTTSDGTEFDSLEAAQQGQLEMLLNKAASALPPDKEQDLLLFAATVMVGHKTEVVAILSNRKPRKDRGTKRAKAKPAKPAEKEAKAPTGGITFGKGGVTKEQP